MRLLKGLILSLSLIALSHAQTIDEDIDIFASYARVINVSVGPGITHPGKSQYFSYTPQTSADLLQSNVYLSYPQSRGLGFGELYFALEHPINSFLQGQAGIEMAAAVNTKLKGVISFNDLEVANYRYYMTHAELGFKGKVFTTFRSWLVQPYLSGSVANGFNQSYGFKTTPGILLSGTEFTYKRHTAWAFSYNVGAGLEQIFNNHWHFNLGYLFSDWGRSRFVNQLPLPYNYSPPKLAHLYAHQIQFGISYYY